MFSFNSVLLDKNNKILYKKYHYTTIEKYEYITVDLEDEIPEYISYDEVDKMDVEILEVYDDNKLPNYIFIAIVSILYIAFMVFRKSN